MTKESVTGAGGMPWQNCHGYLLLLLILLIVALKVQTHAPDAIRQRNAIFRFSLTDNFDPSLNFPNI
jgi:hypothetical protein